MMGPVKKLFEIRWAFFYVNKTYKYGQWDFQPPDPSEHANKQSRIGLQRVEIHSRHVKSREIKRVLVLNSEIFNEFQWVVCAPAGNTTLQKTIQLPAIYIGLQAVLTDGRICRFMIDGERKEL